MKKLNFKSNNDLPKFCFSQNACLPERLVRDFIIENTDSFSFQKDSLGGGNDAVTKIIVPMSVSSLTFLEVSQ